MSSSKTTTDHATIKQWVEARNGHPATVKSTAEDGDPGLLRIEFPQGDSETLGAITWEDFFKTFEESNLAFLYQEETEGEISRFCKLISRD
ncbi:hypothetical protein IQ241_14875 [Romeria aff. gracilis LEGE 07310]|uniref:1,4-alpha-glucan branching enzyme n=1 Tax=Vasconcelosia minhoensis LEGE 07310 TaxID=915328 RepID=A0A8J7DC58_9CYAN|nr:hypothetical protein [Romeria gracilis]MBE9078562.1 hypothetical protein [Romeria aff. gracilis LEGE 07310]